MAIDRAATLRNAEKLLRQGKIEPAIAEYLRVIEEQPRDWNTANVLGDLYVRAGQVDKAVEQFIRIADTLSEQGFLPKAAAIYKKILKLQPDHEHALLQAAEIGARQGLYADARTYLNTVIEARRARGDAQGAAQARILLGRLDPSDYALRMEAASALVEVGDTAGAVRDLQEIAAELAEKGRRPEAVEALKQGVLLQPDDASVRTQLFDLCVSAEDFLTAREYADSKDQFMWLSSALEERGMTDEALNALREAMRIDPDDVDLRAHLARIFVARGEMARAAEYVTAEVAGSDPQLLLLVAEIRLRDGATDEGLGIVKRLLDEDPSRREQVAIVGWNLAEHAPEVGFKVTEIAADTSVAAADWPAAAAALQEFVTRVPNHIPALLRLIEICVDGGLDATLYSAQAHLADAYIASGMADEARFIAEELVAREPYERANIERFRNALVLLGEPDPDAVIADRLSGQSPFTSTDLTVDEELPPFELQDPTERVPSASTAPSPPSTVEDAAAPLVGARSQFELSANAIDLESILGSVESGRDGGRGAHLADAQTTQSKAERVEVDLSLVIDAIDGSAAGTPQITPARTDRAPGTPQIAPQAANRAAPPLVASDLDSAFAQLRDEATRKSALDAAEAEYERALALGDRGDIDGCIQALTSASKAPKLRFATASKLGRIYKARGRVEQAIEWFESAAQAPAPSPDDYHALLFELAEELEAAGEVARALAVCLELQADAGSYRDVDARVGRLVKVQARG